MDMIARAQTIEMEDVAFDTFLRLADAARIGFPGGGMSAASLRRERDAGRLDVWLIAGKEFTSLAAIEVMKKKCLNLRKVRASGSNRSDALPPEASSAPRGSFETENTSGALAALEQTLKALSEHSKPISPKSTRGSRRAPGHVIHPPSRSQTC
jgi:hypothetical protein